MYDYSCAWDEMAESVFGGLCAPLEVSWVSAFVYGCLIFGMDEIAPSHFRDL